MTQFTICRSTEKNVVLAVFKNTSILAMQNIGYRP